MRVRQGLLEAAERRVDRPLRVVLVCDGRAEQRHDPIAQELVDGSLHAVDFGQHELKDLGHEPVDFLRVESLGKRVNPETSTKRTVTCLRSPSSAPFEVRISSARC